jgi:hypothetical protein
VRSKIIRAGSTLIDDDDRFFLRSGLAGKSKSGKHHEGRTDNQQRIRPVDHSCRVAHTRLWHSLAEHHYVGFDDAITDTTTWNREAPTATFGKFGIAVRIVTKDLGMPVWIPLFEIVLEIISSRNIAAIEAANIAQITVQFNDTLVAGGMVQSVHVLRDQRIQPAARFKISQCRVGSVRASF